MKLFKKILLGIGCALLTVSLYSQNNNKVDMTNATINDTIGRGNNILEIENADSLRYEISGTQVSTLKATEKTYYVELIAEDSLRLPYAEDLFGTDEQILMLSRTLAVFGDSMSASANEGLTDTLIDFKEWVEDTVGGEGLWMRPNGEAYYGVRGRVSDRLYSIVYMLEMLIRDRNNLVGKIEELEANE